ncbi:ribonuclease H2, subunit B [Achaetomium macrosporum]|uniref:Ribonuclease H2 subunit B n=1 Tax=Achaetomium macrosporum TaxID=79813 RepID=A0AAN7CL36_9PEZI|nr:ribonuclease H2, subunit B [Achaetomium macrosporum]
MARTRSKGAAGTAAASADKKVAKPCASVYTLPAESDNPPKLFILPKTASRSARIVTLQHPRYSRPTRYLVCPEAGFFEFTQICPPKSAPRSWLIQPAANDDNNNGKPPLDTQVTQSPALHVATPFDPLFLLLPALCATTTPSAGKRMFLSADDHLDALPDPSRHLAEILASWPATRALIETRLAAVCDVVQAGDENMYRVSEAKLLGEVLRKARRMVEEEEGSGTGGGLPPSMEERFVRRELEAPVLGVRVARGRDGNVARTVAGEEPDGSGGGNGSSTPGEESAESQSSVSSVETTASSASAVSAVSTAATSVADDDGVGGGEVASAMKAPEEVVKLQRLRVAFNFVCSSYVAPAMAQMLQESLAKATGQVDFKPLDEYLARLANMRQEAAAARSADFSRKRTMDEEEDERVEKRRKKEAEEKAKKANMSRGVKELMKVNTSGMKKMSDFFKKKT